MFYISLISTFQEYFGNACTEQVDAMLRHFYPDVPAETAAEFSSLIPSNTISMAELQGHFLLNKDNLEGLIGSVRSLYLPGGGEKQRLES